MSTAVTTLANNLATKLGMGSVGQELITTLKATVFKGEATDAQFTALLIVANQYGLNPWTREIYAFPDRQNGIVPVVGVDGWSRIINEHPQFDGLEFTQDDESCTCIIYRKDRGHAIKTTEYFNECYREAFKNKSGYEIKTAWQTHPKRMMRHKSLIQCARLAFGYSGIFDADEAEGILEKDITPQGGSNSKNEDKPVLPYCTDENFNKNLSAWSDLVLTNKKTPEGLINQLKTKYLFTDDQQKIIHSWGAIEGQSTVINEPEFA